MAIIVDRRQNKSSKNASNRDRFIKRYKRSIQRAINRQIGDRSIKDVNKPWEIELDESTQEGHISHDSETGQREFVTSGNKKYIKGDTISRHNDEEEDGSGAGDGGEGEDSFLFTLTKEEFYELFFDDLALPDFVKEAMIDNTKMIYKRAGYIKEGAPVRLDVRKTMEMALARKIATRDSETKVPYLDDLDLRYRHFKEVPQPMCKAVMFCLMDVSGSMGEHHKLLSKKFFILLFLFLQKNYEKVDVRFVRYHHRATDCNEEDFFYSQDTGGTMVSEGLARTKQIIEAEYNPEDWNIYISHTSDGDYYGPEVGQMQELISDLLGVVQYYAYLQVQEGYEYRRFESGEQKLYGLLSTRGEKNLACETAVDAEDIYPVLSRLFKDKKGAGKNEE